MTERDVEAVLRMFLTGDGYIAECDIPHIVVALTAQSAAQASPKRRPYNESGSLSEYGIFPECDAALATAAKDAKIAGLRAEVAEWKRVASAQAELHGKAEARAERLAEALALLPDDSDMVEHNPEEGPRMACCGQKVQVQFYGSIYTHDEDCWYARMRALRDHDQEDRND